MDEIPRLHYLAAEWLNMDAEEMKPYFIRVMALKDEKTYPQAMADVASGLIKASSRCVDYISHLLYLIDERNLTIMHLQAVLRIQPGHLYRNLKRAGVDFRAVQSKTIESETPLLPWRQAYYVDYLNQTILMDGIEYPFDSPHCAIKVWLDEDAVYRVAYQKDSSPKPPPPLFQLPERFKAQSL